MFDITTFDPATPYQVVVPLNDGRHMATISGTALLDFTGSHSDFRRDVARIIVGPSWARLDAIAPTASLATIYNKSTANNAGWAVDNAQWELVGNRIGMRVAIAVSETDGRLLRFSFSVTAVGVLSS